MSTVDFTLLNVSAEEVRLPTPFPVGGYKMVITGSVHGHSSKKKTPFLGFMCKATEIIEADDEELEAFGDWQSYEFKPSGISPLTFYLSADSLWSLVSKDNATGEYGGFFADVLGMDIGGKKIFDEENPDECLENLAIGLEFTGVVGHEQNEDGTRTFASIVSVASL